VTEEVRAMRVRDVMTTDVITATPETGFQDLVGLLLDGGVSGIPIVDDAGCPVGIVSEADMISKEAYQSRRHLAIDAWLGQTENVWAAKSRGLRAVDLMSAPVRCVRPDDLVRLAAARMVATGVNRLPVVDANGRLVGIVSRSDVLRIFHRSDGELRAAVEKTLDDPLLVPAGHGMTASIDGGVVTLTGRAAQSAHVRLAENALREIVGVVDVVVRVDIDVLPAERGTFDSAGAPSAGG
jgi:CBS-domain-containing membrane protein